MEVAVKESQERKAYPLGKVFQVPTRWGIKETFLWGDMTITDAWGNEVFKAVSNVFGFTRQLNFMDLRTGEHIAYIKQRALTLLPKYDIYVDGGHFASMEKEWAWTHKFTVTAFGLVGPITVQGDWLSHSYEFCRENRVIAEVHKRFLTLTDTYSVDIQPGEDVIFILACCMIIDKCTFKRSSYRARHIWE
ncbi:LURP-one-related domain-containing protein [Ditylenchus destructor]|uniref:LURP-one-related domain-containing protein n=1 Tax=Ditylenchus destructor TaxID=166010 RepID=A0AAD4MXL9_9BILA|nr:LURP-one-related domain-containing protein [Ditylenchus destructor]